MKNPIAERIAMHRQAQEREDRLHPHKPAICPDCGIDMPARWHWDGCKHGKVVRR